MHWTEKYLCPLVENDKFRWKKVKSIIKDFIEIIIHSLSFHKQPKEPLEQLPEFSSKNDELIYNVCKEFYNNANDRIDKLEDKAIKLLSYISAIFAFISFTFVNTALVFTKVMLIISLIALVLAIIISFRCVNIKGRKTFFVPSVYSFEKDVPEEHFDKKIISKVFLNSAIYNQNIADNTADVLKGARYALTIAILISTIGFLGGAFSCFTTTLKDSTVKAENHFKVNDIDNKIDITNKTLADISNNIKVLNDNKQLKEQIDKLNNELTLYKSSYEDLSKRIGIIEKDTNSRK